MEKFLAKRAHLSTLQVRKALDPYNDPSVSNKSYNLYVIKTLFTKKYPKFCDIRLTYWILLPINEEFKPNETSKYE